MSDRPSKAPKQIDWKVRLLLLGGIVAAILIIYGLATDPLAIDTHSIAWYERIPLFFLSFTEDAWFIGKHEHVPLIIGAVLARLVFLSALLLAAWAVFSRHFQQMALSRRRGHTVVIGNTATAREVAAHLPAKTRIHVVASDTDLAGLSNRGRIALPFHFAAIARPAALAHAKRIIIDTGEVTCNMTLVRAIRDAFGDRAPPISCNIESTHIADEFGDLLGVQRDLLIYDEARLSVRDTLARYPLYAMADRQAASRVHLLIVGFGRLGRVFLEAAVQDSIAGTLQKPYVTVIDANADAEGTAFERDKPAHPMAADVAFIQCDILDTPLDADGARHSAALIGRDIEAPVTAIALCLDNDADTIKAAMALRAMRRRSGRCFVPILMHVQDANSDDIFMRADEDRIVDPFDSIIPIRLSREALAVEILGEGERDVIAKRIHAAYRELADDEQAANVTWIALDETYRRAARNAADHIGAKLWSLGLSTERQSTDTALAVDTTWERQWRAEADPAGPLARLEHERWIADRVMEGWRPAVQRDDDRRFHPDLVPFDALTDKEKAKDAAQIGLISALIEEAGRDRGKRFMPELTVGLAAEQGIDPAIIATAKGQIDRDLTTPLADFAERYVITFVSALSDAGEFALVEAAVAAFRQRIKRKSRWSRSFAEDVDLRLVALEAVPYQSLLKRVHKHAKMKEHEIHAGFAARRKLFEQFTRVEVVRLGARGHSNDEAVRNEALAEDGLSRVNAYLARRCDVLCTVVRGKREAETAAGRVAELDAFRHDGAAIPGPFDPGVSRRAAPRPDVAMKRDIRIDV